ncbi:MAG: nucleotidyltransferase domain-containing protein [bacterium]
MTKSKKSDSLSKDEIVDFLKKNKLYIKKEFGVTKIALFGSYSRDEQKNSSDIDLLIESNSHDFRKRMKLKHFLEESLKKQVDIGYFDSVRFAIKRNIQEDLIYA